MPATSVPMALEGLRAKDDLGGRVGQMVVFALRL